MKIFKKNQIIIYVIVLMLMTAGYLNFTTKQKDALQTSTETEEIVNDESKVSGIGDARLVSNNEVVSEENTTNTIDTSKTNEINDNTNMVDSNTIQENVLGSSEETSSGNEDEYFTKSKLERDTMYSQMIETYENILNSSNSLETQKQSVTQEIQKINETKNSIMICENLIKTKGFENSVIFVNGDSISVVIGSHEEIKQEEVAQIQNIISREFKANIENIHISTK